MYVIFYKLQQLLRVKRLCVCMCLWMAALSTLVSHLYGFGLLDAESMVKEAERWKQVPSQHECVEEASIQQSRYHTNNTANNLHFEFGLPPYSPSHFYHTSSISVSALAVRFVFPHGLFSYLYSSLCFLHSHCALRVS